LLETPKDLNTSVIYKGLVRLYKGLHTSEKFRYVTMDNQQEIKVIFILLVEFSETLRGTLFIQQWRYSPAVSEN